MSESTPPKGLTPLLLLIIVVSAAGFWWATRTDDYALTRPTAGHDPSVRGEDYNPSVPIARTYAQKREDGESGDVAGACTDCHVDRVSEGARGHRHEHPINVLVPANANLEALSAFGGRTDTDADGRQVVICRSCHRPHNLDVKPRLVAPAADGTLCLTCHTDHAPALSQHPVRATLDPAHRARVAAIGGSVGSGLGCISCHTPHEATSAPLLRTPQGGTGACRSCHVANAAGIAAHGHGDQTCEDCHGMHKRPAQRGQGGSRGNPGDQACRDCHVSGGDARQIPLDRGHPSWSPTTACQECHNPHSDSDHLLERGSVFQTCLSCHEDKATVVQTKHDPAVSPELGDADGCVACHDVHGDAARPADPTGVNPASARCLACHDGRTEARVQRRYSHPVGLLLTANGLPTRYSGNVPFFDASGHRTTDLSVGEITCQSCHDPHTWKHDADEHPGRVEGTEQNSFLRDPDQVALFCTVCHGVDGRPRFRFFHGDEYRAPAP